MKATTTSFISMIVFAFYDSFPSTSSHNIEGVKDELAILSADLWFKDWAEANAVESSSDLDRRLIIYASSALGGLLGLPVDSGRSFILCLLCMLGMITSDLALSLFHMRHTYSKAQFALKSLRLNQSLTTEAFKFQRRFRSG